MAYRFFRLNCTIRIIVLAATVFGLFYLLTATQLYATSLLVAVVIIGQILALIHYVEKTNRELSRFLGSIRYADFSQSFTVTQKGASFAELNAAFNSVIADFQKARADKEEQYRYLQTVVQHVGLGLLAFDQSGEVDFINNAAKRLLQVPFLKNINSLASFSPELVQILGALRSGRKALVKIDNAGEVLQLAVYATEFKLRDRAIKLVSMQDIGSELAEQEMDAWQKLIRVLTHEIMNSVTPIASLASTVDNLISQSGANMDTAGNVQISPETREDIHQASATIEKRSQGLLRFIDAYRNLTRIPKPDFKIVPVAELLDKVVQLMKGQLTSAGIETTITVDPETLEVTADRGLVEQVLINLVLNAIQALTETPRGKIALSANLNERGRVVITVTDNGPGIEDDVKEKIFTPFYTTRKEGSGIGLSLSRQIMRLHKGSISVQSIPGEKTVFILRF
ncbi:MAG: ATP-binding protein [candidate division Zixibacteria bacterium]|nr:ATP-binding protein [candidate division Zixibacteria bacterium]